MAYKLRFVQKFQQANAEAFIKLEKRFIQLELKIPEFPKGRRYTPVFSKEPLNTLIWECEFPNLEKAIEAQQILENNSLHKELFDEQARYFMESWAEIYKSVEE